MKRTTRRLLKLIGPLWGRFALAALLGFATIGSSLGLMATSAFLIAKAALLPSIAALQIAIVGVRFFGIARGLFRYAERYVAHNATFRLLARLRAWFYTAVEPLAPAGLLGYRSGDLLGRVVADIETLEQFYLRVVAPPLVALLVAALACALLGWFNLWLGLALLAALLLAGVGLPLLALVLSRTPGALVIAARADLTAAAVDHVQGAADLLVFGRAGQVRADIERLGKRLARAQERMAVIHGMHGALVGLLASLAGLVVLALAIPLVRAGRLDGVYLALIALTATAAFEAVAPLSQAAQHMGSSWAAARRLFAIADSRPAVIDPAGPSPVPLHAGIEMRELCFSYPLATEHTQSTQADYADWFDLHIPVPAGILNQMPALNACPNSTRPRTPFGKLRTSPRYDLRPGTLWAQDAKNCISEPGSTPRAARIEGQFFGQALTNVSFRLPPGGRMAIVGPSGAGKSTLVQLLLRFWEYEQGQIYLGGHELRQYRAEDARRMISVVSQDTHLFNGTIGENLLLARPGASAEELDDAAEQAQIYTFIQGLPRGYDTWIGEQGLRLSGGERQRLALARAFLKDAPILILDEPTAHLDATTARAFLRALDHLMAGRTTLMITHRLAGLETIDHIIVLEGGRIVEQGRHHDLLALGGRYWRMWEQYALNP